MEEIWKDIEGYEGLYQVSNLGRVKSVDRVVNAPHNSKRLIKSRVKALNFNNRGYFILTLWNGSFNKTFYLHRLVALAFLSNEDNKPEVNHIDGDKTNNNVENLEWVTSKENKQHAIINGLVVHHKGQDHPSATITNAQAKEIKEDTSGLTQKELGKKYGVKSYVISQIKRGVRWKHI